MQKGIRISIGCPFGAPNLDEMPLLVPLNWMPRFLSGKFVAQQRAPRRWKLLGFPTSISRAYRYSGLTNVATYPPSVSVRSRAKLPRSSPHRSSLNTTNHRQSTFHSASSNWSGMRTSTGLGELKTEPLLPPVSQHQPPGRCWCRWLRFPPARMTDRQAPDETTATATRSRCLVAPSFFKNSSIASST